MRVAIAIGLSNEKVIRIGKGLPDLRPAGDRSGTLLGLVAWLVLLAGLIVAPLSLVAAVFAGNFFGYWGATVGIALLVASRYLFTMESNGSDVNWRPLRIGTMVTAGLWAYWFLMFHQRDNWLPEDDEERKSSPPFVWQLNEFYGGMPVASVKTLLSANKFRMHCYNDLGPRERIEATDTDVCWIIPSTLWGIPSHQVSFIFGPEGLRHVMAEFAPEDWPAVERWFNGLPAADAGTFGTDPGGNTIRGRMLDSGLVLTAPPSRLPTVTVLWNAGERLLTTQCAERGLTPAQRQLICRPAGNARRAAGSARPTPPP